jgi:hypothetical protein
VDALEDEATLLAIEIDDPFGAQQVRATLDHQLLEPREQAVAIERAMQAERDAIDLMIMPVVVVFVFIVVWGRDIQSAEVE